MERERRGQRRAVARRADAGRGSGQGVASEGFTLETVRRTAARRPGTVVDQAPQAGAELEEGAQVMAVVSSGQRAGDGAEPRRQHRRRGRAAARRRRACRRSGRRSTRRSRRAPSWRRTRPTERDVPKGSTVTLSVSSGKGQVKVPAVQGMSQADAVTAIVDAGLVAGLDPGAVAEAAGHGDRPGSAGEPGSACAARRCGSTSPAGRRRRRR